MKTAYLSGPMSGIEDYNYPTFNAVAAVLREAGIAVHNPAETLGGESGLPREWYLRFDLATIPLVDMVLLLPGWRNAPGAKSEVIVATEVGIPCYELLHATTPENITVVQVEVEGWSITEGPERAYFTADYLAGKGEVHAG